MWGRGSEELSYFIPSLGRAMGFNRSSREVEADYSFDVSTPPTLAGMALFIECMGTNITGCSKGAVPASVIH